MKVRVLKQLLRDAGWSFVRQGKGDHEIWGKDGRRFPIDGADGDEIPIGTLRHMLKLAGIHLGENSKKRKS